ncbi:MAG TPA: GYF domain-containing protein [Polyangiaceae bacterium]|jgi:predicted Zn finger-like uncharacterized protein|nr:GYF domain-containing protein [Polyangiaceae bacterium]
MKFLCPQCKAKYRIADEKLQERHSSRMKCRKCGHVIDIHSATVPDDSIPPPGVAANEPEPVLFSPPQAQPQVQPKKTGPAVPRVGAGAAAGASPVRRPTGAGVGAGASPALRRPTAAAATATAAAVKRPVPPPRRGGAAVAQAAIAEKAAPIIDEQALATAPAATKPSITKPSAEPVPKAEEMAAAIVEPAPKSVAGTKSDFEEEPTRIHDGSSLAAAFSNAATQSVAAASVPVAVDEWYIGIDGTPLGPVGQAVLRQKAAERKANLESLVWKEGFEEWKALKHFPELVALVEEARREFPAESEPHTIRAPSAVEAAAAAAAAPARVAGASTSAVPSDLLDQLAARPKGVSHPAAWTAVIVAIAFGVTIGAVLLSKTEKQEVVKYVEVPASAAAPTASTTDPMVLEESTVSANSTKKAVTTAQKPETTPVPTAKTGMTSLNGLNGLNGLGPATGGPDVAQNPNPGGQLDGNSIQRVVANFSNSVRRGCWDGALAARTPDAPSTARVGVTITISPTGSVDNVTTTGDPKGYPNLAHCIESKVRGWHFPRSSGTTTAQVPFVFAAQ